MGLGCPTGPLLPHAWHSRSCPALAGAAFPLPGGGAVRCGRHVHICIAFRLLRRRLRAAPTGSSVVPGQGYNTPVLPSEHLRCRSLYPYRNGTRAPSPSSGFRPV
eukprot:362485-Prorocentrum_lima.AAC.1